MINWEAPNSQYKPPRTGEPPLHRAARIGDDAEIRRLVADGAEINASFDMRLDPGACECELTPMMVAAGSGDGASVETLRTLIGLGADPGIELSGGTALVKAFCGLGWNYRPGGDIDRVRFLLESGCQLPTEPDAANRVLCEVALIGDPDRLRFVLDQGVNPNGFFDPEVARDNARAAMEQMNSYMADEPSPFADLDAELREEVQDTQMGCLREALERGAKAPSSFEIPLFRAAEAGNVACVRLLIESGANPMIRDNSHRTALYYANSAEVIRLLLDAGVPIEDSDEFEWSPLVDALCGGDYTPNRVRWLIEAGADVNASHDRGYTVFMSAVSAEFRSAEVLKLLVESGADPHAVSEAGYNAFHAAIDVNGEANADSSVRETFGFLRQLGVNIEHRNRRNQTPLVRAIEDGTGIEVRVLCELGADPNVLAPDDYCGGDRCTADQVPALFRAAGAAVDSDLKTEALLRAGANPLVEDREACSVLSRVVAELCADARDYDAAFDRLIHGLIDLDLSFADDIDDRDAYISEVTPMIREHVERFSAELPSPGSSDFELERRKSQVSCVVLLFAFECWAYRSGCD